MSIQSEITRITGEVSTQTELLNQIKTELEDKVNGYGIPIDVPTEAGMNAVLTADNVGRAYRYTGPSGVYMSGDIYIVERA